MSKQDLKPCPFCGDSVKLELIQDDCYWYYVSCKNLLCEVLPHTWLKETAEEAIEAWNRRAKDDCI